jgi:hypothetical protein
MHTKNIAFKSLLVALASAALLGTAACTVVSGNTSNGSTADSGVTMTTGGGSGSAPCGQTLSCIASCPDNDDPCANSCYEQASPKGQELVNALVTCIDSKACADSACVKSGCSAELSACQADVAVERDSGVAPTPGSPLPASLVGSWSSVSSQYGQIYTFYAGGTYDAIFAYEPSGRCLIQSKFVTYVEGAASADATTLTLSPANGHSDTTSCGGDVTRKPLMPPNRALSWSVSAGTLTLQEAGSTPTTYKRN